MEGRPSARGRVEFNRRAGFDVIGMTNSARPKCAREAEIAYATLAMVTDYDCWKADEEHVTVDLIVENLHRNAALAQAIVADVLPRIPAAPSNPATTPCAMRFLPAATSGLPQRFDGLRRSRSGTGSRTSVASNRRPAPQRQRRFVVQALACRSGAR